MTKENDFGLSAVDEASLPAVSSTQVSPEIDGKLDEILERLAEIERNKKQTEGNKELEALRQRLKDAEACILPLLERLLKTADDGDYIKWPNRKVIIQQQIDKLLKITR